MVLPVPFSVVAWGVVGAEQEHVVRVGTPGEFHGSDVSPGQVVGRGDCLVRLTSPSVNDLLQERRAALRESVLKWEIARDADVVEFARTAASIRALRNELQEAERRSQRLTIQAPEYGRVLRSLPESQRGKFLQTGDPIGLVASGRPLLRAWLTQDQLNAITADEGTRTRFRIPGRSSQTFFGT
jgi:putative peptide zinc metalloprotease protein